MEIYIFIHFIIIKLPLILLKTVLRAAIDLLHSFWIKRLI